MLFKIGDKLLIKYCNKKGIIIGRENKEVFEVKVPDSKCLSDTYHHSELVLLERRNDGSKTSQPYSRARENGIFSSQTMFFS